MVVILVKKINEIGLMVSPVEVRLNETEKHNWSRDAIIDDVTDNGLAKGLDDTRDSCFSAKIN